jgi:hypothetical protein
MRAKTSRILKVKARNPEVMKKAQNMTKEDALEIIELSTESVDTLTKAFELITQACADEAGDKKSLDILNDDHVAPTIH